MSKQLAPADELKNSIMVMKPQFKAALPKHITTEKFTRVLMTAVSSNSKLVEANRTTLFSSCMRLAQMGLMPDGKEAAIVTFNSKSGVTAQAMPMVSGLLKLVRNSGELASLATHVVYDTDAFNYWIDENGEHIKHVPSLGAERGQITHAYAMAKLKDGSVYLEVMPKVEIDKVRAVSRAKDSGPWVEWYGEMAKKSAVRRLIKRLPLSTDIEAALAVDDETYDFEQKEKDVSPAPQEKVEQKTKPSRLKQAIKSKVEEMPKDDEPKEKVYAPSFDSDEELPKFEDDPL